MPFTFHAIYFGKKSYKKTRAKPDLFQIKVHLTWCCIRSVWPIFHIRLNTYVNHHGELFILFSFSIISHWLLKFDDNDIFNLNSLSSSCLEAMAANSWGWSSILQYCWWCSIALVKYRFLVTLWRMVCMTSVRRSSTTKSLRVLELIHSVIVWFLKMLTDSMLSWVSVLDVWLCS